MADNVPVHNALTIKLANQLEDPLLAGADNGITASTDGTRFTAVTLNGALGDSYNWIANLLVTRMGVTRAKEEATGLRGQQTIALGTAGAAVNKDFVAAVRLFKSNRNVYAPGDKSEWENADDIRIAHGYAIEGGKLYAYDLSGNTFVAASGTGTLYYIKSDRKDVTNGTDVAINTAPDVTLEARWHELVLRRACWRALMDVGAPEFVERANAMLQEIDRILKELGL